MDTSPPGRVDWHPRHVRLVHRYALADIGLWSCSRCGRMFPVDASWAVDHQLDPHTQVRTFVVCPDCASAVRPTRLVVDVERVSASDHRPLRALVEDVVSRRRRRGHGPELRLRAEDTVTIASSEERPLREVVNELRARGLVRVV